MHCYKFFLQQTRIKHFVRGCLGGGTLSFPPTLCTLPPLLLISDKFNDNNFSYVISAVSFVFSIIHCLHQFSIYNMHTTVSELVLDDTLSIPSVAHNRASSRYCVGFPTLVLQQCIIEPSYDIGIYPILTVISINCHFAICFVYLPILSGYTMLHFIVMFSKNYVSLCNLDAKI